MRLPTLAKAGEPILKSQTHVAPKRPGQTGQWVCVTCGERFRNNLHAFAHPTTHALAWQNYRTGDVEEA